MRDLLSGDPPPLPNVKILAVFAAAIALGYREIAQKGVVAAVRLRSVPEEGFQVETHIDWDDGAYDGLIAHAKLIKEDRIAQEYLRRKYHIQSESVDGDGF